MSYLRQAIINGSHTDSVVLNLELNPSSSNSIATSASFTGSFDQKIVDNWSLFKAAVIRFSCRGDLISFMSNKGAWKVAFQANNLTAPQTNATVTKDVLFVDDYPEYNETKNYPANSYFNIQSFVNDVNRAIKLAYDDFLTAIGGVVAGHFNSGPPFLLFNEETSMFSFAGPAIGYNADSSTEVKFMINHMLWTKIPGFEGSETDVKTPNPFPWYTIPFKCRGYLATGLKYPYEMSTSFPDAKDYVLNKQKTKALSALQDVFTVQVVTTSLPIRTEITPVIQTYYYSQIQYEEQITDFIIDLDQGGLTGLVSFVAPYLRYFDFTSNNASGQISFSLRLKYSDASTYPILLPPGTRASIKLQIETKKHMEQLLAKAGPST
jgi:hypothetical protein